MLISWSELLKILILAMAQKAAYEAWRPDNPGPASCPGKLTDPKRGGKVSSEPDELPPQVKKWARKAARNYARAQIKKWRNWEKAMFDTRP